MIGRRCPEADPCKFLIDGGVYSAYHETRISLLDRTTRGQNFALQRTRDGRKDSFRHNSL